jgi:hypothetical protein
VWLTPEEKNAWKNKAASSGMNLNDYIRCCVERRKIPQSLPEVNRLTAVKLGKSGVNLNQQILAMNRAFALGQDIPIIDDLRILLTNHHPGWNEVYLLPGRLGSHLDPDSADKILRKAIRQVGLIGVSSHSFRRTALTMTSDNRTPLRVIQEVSEHRNLEQLQAYIEVRDEQVLGAVTGLSMLSPVGGTGKWGFTNLARTARAKLRSQ